MQTVVERLQRYARFDTKSDPQSSSCPSTPGQLRFAEHLKEELEQLGMTEISLNEEAYLFATLPGNVENAPTIGFLAHLDTSPDYPGECTNSRVVRYEGHPIPLGTNKQLDEATFPFLAQLKGEELIVTSGDTLLGGDDKAGIAEIMTALEYLQTHPEIPHGPIRVGFTPDEEIGRGPHRFDVDLFHADFAYTFDGGWLGELSMESFNAASATLDIQGESIHPGSAKDKLVNAALLGMEFHQMLPIQQRPEYTDGYEGFFLLLHIDGTVETCHMEYIIRDFDREKFEKKKECLRDAVAFLEKKYGKRFKLEIKDSYKNMGDVLKDQPEVVERAIKAMKAVEVEPLIQPIRGGTDGSQLTYMGLPCPNLFAGYLNAHGPYEIAVVSWMEKASELLVEIVRTDR